MSAKKLHEMWVCAAGRCKATVTTHTLGKKPVEVGHWCSGTQGRQWAAMRKSPVVIYAPEGEPQAS